MDPDQLPWAIRPVDNYCERLSPDFWAEPLNAATNLSFVIAALIMLFPALRARDGGALALVVILGLIGIGSFLFHTLAVGWTGPADVLPILAFILLYVYLAARRFLNAPIWAGTLAVLAVIPFSIASAAAIRTAIGSLNGSEGYVGTLVLFFVFAALTASRAPEVTRGILAGAGLLTVSLVFRSVDKALCGVIPVGTHFLWHFTNGLLLGWMIHLLLRHRRALAPRLAGG